MVATSPRSGVRAGREWGWTLLASRMTYVLLAGSIQMEVPVKPVWP